MLESEWLRSSNPLAMLRWLESFKQHAGTQEPFVKSAERKLRLFAIACWLHGIRQSVMNAPFQARYDWAATWIDHGCHAIELEQLPYDTDWLPHSIMPSRRWLVFTKHAREAAESFIAAVHHQIQSSIMRDIFGNPFKTVTLAQIGAHSWYSQQASSVFNIARTIYDTASWQDMPILHDALVDAGCTNEDLLKHCQGYERCWLCTRVQADRDNDACSECGQLGAIGPFGRPCAPGWTEVNTPHVRGCWGIDILLGNR